MAELSADGTRILNNYDNFTGVPFNATKVTTYADGTPMTDAKVDNGVYFKVTTKLGGGYAKRDYTGAVMLKWWSPLVTVKPSSDPSTWDWAPAITALNNYVASQLSKFSSIGDTFNLIQGKVDIYIDGTVGFSNTLIFWPGANYYIPAGTRLYAQANGQTIVRTPTVAELTAAGAVGATYGSKNINVFGKGIIDGVNKASIGFISDTTALDGRVDLVITRCTYRRYSTTCTGTSASKVIAVPDATLFQVNDTVKIEGSAREFYNVVGKSGNNVTLGETLGTNLTNAVLSHRAAGMSCNMAQQSQYNILAVYNDIGWVFGHNKDSIACTDMKMMGMSEHNMIGEVVIAGDIKHTNCTIQHNFETEIIAVGSSGGLWDGLYVETMADSQANSLIPPIGSTPIGVTALHASPLIRVLGGRPTFKNINFPINPTNTSWRRLMFNAGDTVIQGITTGTNNLLVNPSIAGDYGLVVQDTALGNILMSNIRGIANLSVAGPVLVCKPDGTAPNTSQASWDYSSSSNWRKVFANNRWITWVTGAILDIYRKGEAQARLSLYPGSIGFGNGVSATPLVLLDRGSVAGTLTTGRGGFVPSRVGIPASSTTAGLPGDIAVGTLAFYFYTGDGTTHQWYKIDAGELGSNKGNVKPVSSATTLLVSDYGSTGDLTVLLDATNGAFTLSMPPAAASLGLTTYLIKVDATAFVVTVKGNGTELINNANTDATLTTQNTSFILKSTGTKHYKF